MCSITLQILMKTDLLSLAQLFMKIWGKTCKKWQHARMFLCTAGTTQCSLEWLKAEQLSLAQPLLHTQQVTNTAAPAFPEMGEDTREQMPPRVCSCAKRGLHWTLGRTLAQNGALDTGMLSPGGTGGVTIAGGVQGKPGSSTPGSSVLAIGHRWPWAGLDLAGLFQGSAFRGL